MNIVWSDERYCISTQFSMLDFEMIHRFLAESYWASGISREAVEKSARHSMPFGVYQLDESERPPQVGYARVLTDFTRFAYLLDVFIVEPHRGHGLARHLTHAILNHAALKGIATWQLGTRDAHGLYEKFGFQQVTDPRRFMRRVSQS
jgi:GNAT superfamily N-acetyltransferase